MIVDRTFPVLVYHFLTLSISSFLEVLNHWVSATEAHDAEMGLIRYILLILSQVLAPR